MRANIVGRRIASTLLVASAALIAGCGGDDPETLAVDSALARDLTLAAPDLANLELSDSALASPRPSRSPAPSRTPSPGPAAASTPRTTPAPTPVRTPVYSPPAITPEPSPTPAPAPAPRKMIAAGTAMSMSIGSRVCTSNRVGDKFVATLTEPVIGSNGASIPAGTRAVIEVASVTPATDGSDPRIVFRVRTIATDQGPVAPVGDAIPQDTLEKVRVGGGSDA